MKQNIIDLCKYGVVGCINTALSYLVYVLLISFNIHYIMASVAGYLVSTTSAFLLNTTFVFNKSSKKPVYSFNKFCKTFITYAFTGVILYNLMLILWIEVLKISKLSAPFINVVFNFPINYLLNKYWAHRVRKEVRDRKQSWDSLDKNYHLR